MTASTGEHSVDENAIAVVGLALRTAGAQTPEQFWALLREGHEALTTFTDEQLRRSGLSDAEIADPALVRTRPVLDGIEQFDPGRFGLTPREAETTDPQLRLLLECASETLESAAIDPARFDGAISVFAGSGPDSYYQHHLLPLERHDPAARMDHLLGNSKDFLAARIAWSLGLRGPAVNVQAGCATSLVAVHLAAQSLLAGESDLALAGGATVYVPQYTGYRYREGGINSPDGHCRAFSAHADGTTPGDGVAVLALRRLADAIADGDPILGVLEATAVNNDGAGKAGFAAPDAGAQAEAVAEALGVAGIEADELDYLETHGTGTALGDEIEIAALSEGFEGLLRDREHRVLIGTHKPNIGDTWAAAGALGVAKVLLSLTHDELPPSINCSPLNPRIDFDGTPFAVNPELLAWPEHASGRIRRAGVHVFGLGGTNAHAVLAQAPRRDLPAPGRVAELLTLSARSTVQLRDMRKELADHLAAHRDTDLRAFAWTLQSGRQCHAVRAAFIVTDIAEAERVLRDDSQESSNFSVSIADAGVVPGTDVDGLDDEQYLATLRTVGRAWLEDQGDIDPGVLRGAHTPVRLALPGHPYLRQRCWAPEPPQQVQHVVAEQAESVHPRPITLPPYVAPSSATETTVTRIWAAEFGFEQVGVHDDFFDLGGHSLLAARIVDRMREACAVDLSIRELLSEATTPAQLATLINARERVSTVVETHSWQPGMRIPLSAAQRRMWLFMQLYPTSSAYNIGFPMRLRGSVDVEALRRASKRLLARHAALRTRFVVHENMPFAVVDEADDGVDILTVRESNGRTAEQWISEIDSAPFDLGTGPLVRLAFAPGSAPDGPHLMLLCAHHSIADGMSVAVLHSELAELYAAELESRVPQLPARVAQFPDLMLRREDPASKAEQLVALDYWRERLAGEPAALELPADRPRPDTPTFAGHAHTFDVDAAPSAELRALGQRHHASTFALVTAAFITVLHRLTGQTDILTGTVTHGRLDAAERDAVGSFADTVLLRERISPDLPFSTLLDQVRDTIGEALAHQSVAFDELIAELGWDATANRTPIPQAMVIGQQPVQPLRMGGAVGEAIIDRVDTARFDLVCNVWEEDGQIRGAVTGALDIFAVETIARIAESITAALEYLAAEPDSALAEVSIVPSAQRELLYTGWTGAGHPDSADVSSTGIPRGARPPAVPELVLEAARRDPAAVAITTDSASLTYGELDAATARLARRLLDAGVVREQIVAVSLPRGIDYVVSLLGVMRAGAAFVPVDTTWPPERRSQVLAQAGVSLMIADPTAVSEVPQGISMLDVRSDDEPGQHTLPTVDPEQLAYVMFTSGSTGTPKGVMIRHGAIGYRLRWQQGLLDFGPSDAVLFKAPLGFDISINEIFLPLAVGGRLAIVAPEREADIGHLLEVIERDQVTFFYVVASMLDLILDRRDSTTRARSLRYVWCGGEALTDELYGRFAAAFSEATMFHGYGPAEATIGVACRKYVPSGGASTAVTMGTPNPGARVYVLDRRLRPVPVGAVGELYIGGLPLGRGYVNAPGRSAESFVADVVSGLPGTRLYRTGDLAKFTVTGELQFCGRVDHQVKVHGHRVELPELEAVAMRHPAVRRAAVVLDSEGELAAFCQPEEDARCDANLLRQWFTRWVPTFMVPRGITVLDSIPLTTAGKVDRKGLAALAVPVPDEAPDRIAPSGDTEVRLARIWCEVLGVESVGSNRNFFELGGHSMAMVRVQNLIDAEFGVEIALLELFEHTTIGQLATHLDKQRTGEPSTETRVDGDAVAAAKRRAEAAKSAQRAAAARRRNKR
ncbi:non-ribosomal peptide synthetase [Nocardia macrotermitis]|uniref:D-alanine--poly(Phosphoribitol) ligase subunit 1 n=1 Tax=Nocardia macrotermitis TaxID=2585198 RepID=A0A7K0DBQ5_9NOCA|nr:non-ribosomal peptide synthetase [Nocardia macrotermitis]MQY23108.1 D-alanine--poly(phosphoribitol) ligase subunit 1 [Nocardia macrotermitis]